MAEYYYTNNPTSEHEERHFTSVFMGRTLAFETDAGVFSKQHIDPGSEILCKSLPELHGRVLDMGCGWGAMTVMTLCPLPGAGCDDGRRERARARSRRAQCAEKRHAGQGRPLRWI